MTIKLQNQVERGIRARLEEMIHPHIFALYQKQCLPSNYLTKEKQTDVLVTTFIMPQNRDANLSLRGKKHNPMGDHYLLSLTAQ